jgi:hypothetical protein
VHDEDEDEDDDGYAEGRGGLMEDRVRRGGRREQDGEGACGEYGDAYNDVGLDDEHYDDDDDDDGPGAREDEMIATHREGGGQRCVRNIGRVGEEEQDDEEKYLGSLGEGSDCEEYNEPGAPHVYGAGSNGKYDIGVLHREHGRVQGRERHVKGDDGDRDDDAHGRREVDGSEEEDGSGSAYDEDVDAGDGHDTRFTEEGPYSNEHCQRGGHGEGQGVYGDEEGGQSDGNYGSEEVVDAES